MDNERNNYAFWILCNRVTVGAHSVRPKARVILRFVGAHCAPLRCGLCKSFDTVSFSLNLYFQDKPIYSIIKYISDKAVIPC